MLSQKNQKVNIYLAASILIFGVLASGYFILKSRTGSANISEQFNYLLGRQETQTAAKDVDSDSDGLADWEEKTYRSDPKNPDTDSDGYLDGEEAASGFDPTKKAPGDELPNRSSLNPRPLPKNLTKALSLKLTEAIAEGKIKSFDEDGKVLGQDALQQEAGLAQAMQEAVSQQLDDFVIPDISDSEIKISDKTGQAEAQAYLGRIKNILGSIPSSRKPDLEVFAEAMETGDFDQLEENQKNYEAHYFALKEIEVPADLVSFHKGMLGVLWVTNNIYKAVRQIHQDPLKATIAIIKYSQAAEKTASLVSQLLGQLKSYKNG